LRFILTKHPNKVYIRIDDNIYIAKGGFGKVYKANWVDGGIVEWNNKIKDMEGSSFCNGVLLSFLIFIYSLEIK
jgi:hypothetical protein